MSRHSHGASKALIKKCHVTHMVPQRAWLKSATSLTWCLKGPDQKTSRQPHGASKGLWLKTSRHFHGASKAPIKKSHVTHAGRRKTFWMFRCLGIDFPLQLLFWHLLACDISAMSHFASLLEHFQCFPREDVFLIFSLGSVCGNTVPRAVFLRTLPRAQGLYWMISSL